MAQIIGQGGTITLDAMYRDGTNALVDPVGPKVSILDVNGDVVVSLATPTRVSLGHYQYEYAVASDALLGAWAAQWFGTVNGGGVEDEDGFTVVGSGSIVTPGDATFVTNEPWSTHVDVVANYDAQGITDDQMDMACAIASDMLFLLTGSAWPGRGMDKVFPQARWRPYERPGWWRELQGAGPARWGFCSCNRGRDTGCTQLPEIRLPHPNVDKTLTTVTIAGEVFDADSGLWRIDDGRYLVRQDGNGWPCCQRLELDDQIAGGWSVLYGWGLLPDQGGVMASASLGYELALAFTGDSAATSKCRLPKRITHMTRGNTSIAVLDPLTLFKDGLTGLTEVDLWIVSKMLGKLRRGGSIIRPGQVRSVRRTQ